MTEITFIRSVIEVYINFVPCIFQIFFGIKCVCVISVWVVVVYSPIGVVVVVVFVSAPDSDSFVR